MDGALDTTFGTSGYNTDTPGTGDTLNGVGLQSSGKIVAVGYTEDIECITRYNTDGSLDTTFGTSGYNTSQPGTNSGFYGMAVLPDDKIIAVGNTTTGSTYGFVIAKYNSNGSLDTSFGTSGFNIDTPGTIYDSLESVALQSDGKIVGAGSTHTSSNGFAVVRYNSDGSLDTTFGTSGYNTSTPGTDDSLFSIAVQSDDKIVGVGYCELSSTAGFAVVRYNSDGSLDTTFGTSGYNTDTLGTSDGLYGVTLQTDGKIVAVGVTDGTFVIARYNTDGSVDTTFGTSGYNTSTPGSNDCLFCVELQTDGKVVAAGFATISGNKVFTVVRYNTDGSVDTTFGTSGYATSSPSNNDTLFAIVIQADSYIVAVGETDNDIFATTRYENSVVPIHSGSNILHFVSSASYISEGHEIEQVLALTQSVHLNSIRYKYLYQGSPLRQTVNPRFLLPLDQELSDELRFGQFAFGVSLGNRTYVLLQAPFPGIESAVVIPSPLFEDAESCVSDVIVKKSMNNVMRTLIKRSTNRSLKYTFSINRIKGLELEQFFYNYNSATIRLQNWKGEVWNVKLINNPLEFIQSGRNTSEVNLEFEGVKISG